MHYDNVRIKFIKINKKLLISSNKSDSESSFIDTKDYFEVNNIFWQFFTFCFLTKCTTKTIYNDPLKNGGISHHLRIMWRTHN